MRAACQPVSPDDVVKSESLESIQSKLGEVIGRMVPVLGDSVRSKGTEFRSEHKMLFVRFISVAADKAHSHLQPRSLH